MEFNRNPFPIMRSYYALCANNPYFILFW